MRSLFLALLIVAGCGTKGMNAGGDGGAGSSGTAGGITTHADGSVTISLGSFTVPAGGEVYKCQNFANPFGADIDVKTFESHMSAGSHHLLLFYKPGVTDSPLADCSGLEFAATPYGSQRPDDSITFPDGVAALVPSTQGLRLQAHYLNASPNPISPTVEVTLHKAAAGTVQYHAGVYFYINTNINIPADGAPHSLSKTCNVQQDMNVILAGSHMHQHATNFVATTGAGQAIYSTTQWSDPTPSTFAPPMVWTAGTQVTFTCTWVNNTAAPLTFGESAQTNEMCIFSGQFYPITGTKNVINCF
jgi:hypothetical protein